MNEVGEGAARALAAVEQARQRTRRQVEWWGADIIFMMWGAIWLVTNLVNQFLPGMSGIMQGVLIPLGIAGTVIILRRGNLRVSGAWLRQFFTFWLLLFAYGAMWLCLLAPVNEHRIGLFVHTLVLFGFVVMGIWLQTKLFLWVGLSLTAAFVAGYMLLYQWLWAWVAMVGGGTFLCLGVFIRLKLRR